MKRLLAITVLALLAVAPQADAKGLRWVEVCGPSDCHRVSGERVAGRVLIFPPWVMSGAPDDPPARPGRWLRMRVAMDGSKRRLHSVVIPSRGYAGGDQGGGYGYVWERLGREARATYDWLGRGVERYPAASVPGLDATDQAIAADRPLALTIAAAVKRTGGSLSGIDIALPS